MSQGFVVSGVLGIAAAAILVLPGGDARANISSFAIGSAACVKGSASGEASYPWSGLYNNSTTQEMFVECSLPFVWNSASGSGQDTHVHLVSLNVDDRNSSLAVNCEMRLMSLGGDIVESGGGLSTTSSGEQPLTWFVNSDFTMPYVSCSVPRKVGSSISGVQGMQVDWHNF